MSHTRKVLAIVPVLGIALAVVWLAVPGGLAGAGKAYEGTVYLASMGGHIVKAMVKVDPAQPEPINVVKLARIKLNSDAALAKKAYAFHDVRIDHARNQLFWSAYVKDGDAVRAGKVDLATGKVVADVAYPKDQRTGDKGPMYCASGQSKDKFLPVMMGYEGYVDVVDKATMKLERRVYLEHPKIPRNYLWAHGVSSPDEKEFALWMSLADVPGKFPREKEARHLVFVLDAAALAKGEIKILRETTLTGDPKGSALFRGYFTSDGQKLLIAARDRSWVLDAKSLKVLGETKTAPGSENHDMQPLPGDRYALLVLRVPMEIEPGKKGMDGRIQLYDLTRMASVGKAVSVCQSCHADQDVKTTAMACGLDSVWKP